ncbi:MAG: YidB family protein [Rhodospirillaceae bacterium]
MSLLGNVLMKPHMGMGPMAMFGGRRGGISPMTLALLGTLAYRTFKGKGRLADMLGRSAAPGTPGQAPPGGLNDILSPAALSEGLERLVNRLRQNGHAKEAESWVAKGANTPISPAGLEEALGEERIAWLMEQTDMSRQELLEGLSKTLPDAVDELTPEGRVPTTEEARRLM